MRELSTSKKYQVNKTDFKKLGRDFLIGLGGVVITYIFSFTPQVWELIESTIKQNENLVLFLPIIAQLFATLVNFVYRWARDNGFEINKPEVFSNDINRINDNE